MPNIIFESLLPLMPPGRVLGSRMREARPQTSRRKTEQDGGDGG